VENLARRGFNVETSPTGGPKRGSEQGTMGQRTLPRGWLDTRVIGS